MFDLVGFDLETHKIQPGLLAPPIVCGSIARRDKSGVIKSKLLYVPEAISEARACLLTSEVMCGANIAYDFACLMAYAKDDRFVQLVFEKYERGEVLDVSLAQMLHWIGKGWVRRGPAGKTILLDPRTGEQLKHPIKGTIVERFSLEMDTWLCLGRKDAKADDDYRLSYALLDGVPHEQWPEVAKKYPIDDAVNSLEVAEFQVKNFVNMFDMIHQARAAFAEHLGAVWGMRTDQDRCDKRFAELKEQYADQLKRFADFGIFREDGSKDTKVLCDLVVSAYDGNPPRTKGGKVSYAREVLADSANKDLEAFAAVSGTEKLLETYMPFVMKGTTRPININPNALLANGRSSYEGLIQLLPRKGGIRDTFKARDGHVWCSVDYSALESSTLGQVCIWTVGYSRMAEAINSGKDIHALFAAKLLGKTYEEIVHAVKVLKDPLIKDARQMSKAADFGYPGFMGPYKFAQSKRKDNPPLYLCQAARLAPKCGIHKISSWKGHEYPSPACKLCVEQAEKLRLGFLDMWPEVKEYFNWIQLQLEESEVLTQFVSKRVRGGLDAPAAANTLFSGLAADGAKRALWQVSKECYVDRSSPLFGSRVVIFAHDEIICEIPEAMAHDAGKRQAEIMIREMKAVCPDVAIKAEPALMRHWYKDAEPVFDANGRLIPWEPKP